MAPEPLEKLSVAVLALTDVERRVMELLISGKRDKQIAHALGIHTGSVSQCLLRARKKLGATTRSHAVAIFVRMK